MTAALEGGEWSAARHGRTLPPGKTRYPLYRRLCGSQGRSGRAENLVPTGIRSRAVRSVVSRYTDWATGPTVAVMTALKLILISTILKFKEHIIWSYKRHIWSLCDRKIHSSWDKDVTGIWYQDIKHVTEMNNSFFNLLAPELLFFFNFSTSCI